MNFSVNIREVNTEVDRLINLLQSIDVISAIHRRVVAEIILLRLSILIENNLKSIFCKLCCGANYVDGRKPIVNLPSRSLIGAISLMKSHNRPRNRYPIWNDGREIRENVRYIVDNNDHAFRTISNYSSFLTEIRYFRNHIARRNESSRKNYRNIVKKYYGANPPGIQVGAVLLSKRVQRTSVLETHIRSARIMINDIIRA